MAHSIRNLVRLPRTLGGGRIVAYTQDPGDATSTLKFSSQLDAIVHRVGMNPDGSEDEYLDLGSGLTTNVAAQAMANDFGWSSQLNLATLALANFHAWGTGTTAASASDIALQTLAAPTTATAVTGTQSLVSAANLQIYKTSATITAGSSLAITEWGLHSLANLSSSTGSPFTATTASSWQDTGSVQTPSSATVRGLQQTIVVPGTTAVYGLDLSNTNHVAQIIAWYNQSNGNAGATPGSTETFVIKPVLFDHKVYAAINVNSLDTITYNYSATIASGN